MVVVVGRGGGLRMCVVGGACTYAGWGVGGWLGGTWYPSRTPYLPPFFLLTPQPNLWLDSKNLYLLLQGSHILEDLLGGHLHMQVGVALAFTIPSPATPGPQEGDLNRTGCVLVLLTRGHRR